MKKKTNDNLKNKYLLAGLSIFCVLLIVVSFLDGSIFSPVKQASRVFDHSGTKRDQRIRSVDVGAYG